ncbi:MAG: NYN domain-containing protein [Clostridia bacterium]|nr:NYN domain-containing protein [Clostridia bacterium]
MQRVILRLFGKGGEETKQLPSPIKTGKEGLPSAAVFVDYEHWYISLNNNYGIRPNIKAWFEDLQTRVNVKEVMFFADFSHKNLADEIGRIRPYTNKIIDTRSPNGTKKDFTDFIILDNIYQKALLADDIEAFVLFSGDGHFSSVTAFLKNIYGKEVGVYAIKGCFSRQLIETSTWTVALPDEADVYGLYYRKIFEHLKDEENKHSKNLPTFSKVVDAVAKDKRLERKKITYALDKLIEGRVISKRNMGGRGHTAKDVLFVDWELAESKGFYSAEV